MSLKEKAFRSNQQPCASLLFLQKSISSRSNFLRDGSWHLIPPLVHQNHKETLNLRCYLCRTNQRFGGQINPSLSSFFFCYSILMSVSLIETLTYVCRCIICLLLLFYYASQWKFCWITFLQSWFTVGKKNGKKKGRSYIPLYNNYPPELRHICLKDCGAVNVFFWRYFNSVWFVVSQCFSNERELCMHQKPLLREEYSLLKLWGYVAII